MFVALLDRYIARALLPALLGTEVAITTLAYVARIAPPAAFFVLAVSSFVASVWVFARLAGANEFTALHAAGVPLVRIARVPLVVGLVAAIGIGIVFKRFDVLAIAIAPTFALALCSVFSNLDIGEVLGRSLLGVFGYAVALPIAYMLEHIGVIAPLFATALPQIALAAATIALFRIAQRRRH